MSIPHRNFRSSGDAMPISHERHDPSDEFPPTRPTPKMLLMALVVVAIGAAVLNWSQVSAFAHIPQIEHALGW
jgi:hypothetical protein